MKLEELFSLELFEQHKANGYIRVRKHPLLPLWTAGYTEKAQFDRQWDEVTNRCRGLIFDQYENILARPFDKFLNWDEAGQPYPPGGECYVAPKMDGSLGILYDEIGIGYAIATRGSFESDQAIHATELFRRTRWDEGHKFSPMRDPETGEITHTYLFEIIYPANRIVVDYGQDDKLVLLDVIEIASGRSDLFEFHNCAWPDKVTKKLIRGFYDGLVHEIPPGDEGFVVYWPHKNYRVKIKSAEYVALHRIVTGLNARTVWSEMALGKSPQIICDQIPDEFHDWVRDVATQLEDRYYEILDRVVRAGVDAREKVGYVPTGDNNATKTDEDKKARGQFAALVKDHPLKGYIFAWADNKNMRKVIWEDLKPEAGWEPRNTSGDVA